MKQNIVTRDRILILISGFFYFASPMLVTPLITGFSENLGASAALMGVIGGLMNICSLFCRPFVGNLTDKISKYKMSFIGAVLMAAASVGYAAAFSILIVVVIQFVQNKGEPVSVASVYKGTIRSKPRNFGDFLCYPHSAYVQYASIVCLEKPRNSCGWSL